MDVEIDYSRLPKGVADGLREAEEIVSQLGRADAQHAFAYGEAFATAQDLILSEASGLEPQEKKAFAKAWYKKVRFTPRHVANFVAVHRNLGAYRERAVKLGIPPTVLFTVATAPAEKVDAVISSFEEGRPMKVTEVKAFLRGGAAEEDPSEVGGLKVLADIGARNARFQAKLTARWLVEALPPILTAAEQKLSDRAVVRRKLADRIIARAGMAARSLHGLLATDLVHRADEDREAAPAVPEEWRKLPLLLFHLQERKSWPKGDDFHAWLTGEVIPALLWAAEGAVPAKLHRRALAVLEGEGAAETGHPAAIAEEPADEIASHEPAEADAEEASVLNVELAPEPTAAPAPRKRRTRRPKNDNTNAASAAA
ncbi:hypothetical protein L0F51_01625 [Afifella sp. H1R]|uniref:hypothetical protein n=1 Tax=Afifella sp. H1R TaxID=2908841 RepID=UPI001F36ADB7|nr:hypothetical protein [Afifella sp. H1R]MCF1502465.1 hypothetical protein [Afifella sp. H1R]